MYLNKLCEYSEIICLNGTQNLTLTLTHFPLESKFISWKVKNQK